MAISWWTFASNRPATLLACVRQKGYSGQLAREGGEFALCMVRESIRDAAQRCGTCSGCDVDKAEDFGIRLVPASKIAPMLVEESVAAFECKLIRSEPVQDHTLLIAVVVACHIDDGKPLFAMDGYNRLEAM